MWGESCRSYLFTLFRHVNIYISQVGFLAGFDPLVRYPIGVSQQCSAWFIAGTVKVFQPTQRVGPGLRSSYHLLLWLLYLCPLLLLYFRRRMTNFGPSDFHATNSITKRGRGMAGKLPKRDVMDNVCTRTTVLGFLTGGASRKKKRYDWVGLIMVDYGIEKPQH